MSYLPYYSSANHNEMKKLIVIELENLSKIKMLYLHDY